MPVKLKNKTLGAKLGDVRAKALVIVLAYAIAQDGNEKFGNTIGNVQEEAMFYTLARTK